MTAPSALNDVNNAILDLQAADYNTYDRPLKQLWVALQDDELKEINAELTAGLDFDKFVSDSEGDGGMVGSDSLDWPLERPKVLGLTLIMIERAAANPDWFLNFVHHFYSAGSKHIAAIRKATASAIIPFGRDYRSYVEARMKPVNSSRQSSDFDTTKVFIVHGHEEAPREMVARFVESLGLEAIILHEQRNRGRTVVEKLEAFSDVGFAVVLFTPDDVGRAITEDKDQPRARQNVVLELGYFMGKLGRGRVCAIRKGDIDWPSDYAGVVYTSFDEAGAWKKALAEELDEAGYDIDFNAVMKKRRS
ncbi:nucleotide-binding protein [Brevundimonas sp.]|uniref:nucleotide-binding protein n=1 Tax=Brevundimonas sp. TaxID=1871086 RepID=UPI002897C9EF|nr:nucleotide-binding protein [Brevundimonas sp.]